MLSMYQKSSYRKNQQTILFTIKRQQVVNPRTFEPMKFTVTENEMCDLTGYTRRHLQNMRLGSRQIQRGVIYKSDPLLKKGRDWERYGWVILYAVHVSDKLVSRKNKMFNDIPQSRMLSKVTQPQLQPQ